MSSISINNGCYHELSNRFAISKPRKVAPLAKGDLSDAFYIKDLSLGDCGHTYRISVGPKPLVNAPIPSLRHVVRTQWRVDLYF